MGVLSDNLEEFHSQVNDDIRDKASPAIHDALRSPENLDRWIAVLKQFIRNAESQLASGAADRAEKREALLAVPSEKNRIAWLKYVAKRERQRADIIRFKTGTQNKLEEAKLLKSTTINELLDAIRCHRTSIANAPDDFDTSIFDEELWNHA